MLKLKFVLSSFTLLASTMFRVYVLHDSCLLFDLNRYWIECVCFIQWEKLTTTGYTTDGGSTRQQYAFFKGMWPLKNYYIAYYTDSTAVCFAADLLEKHSMLPNKYVVSVFQMLRANLLSQHIFCFSVCVIWFRVGGFRRSKLCRRAMYYRCERKY